MNDEKKNSKDDGLPRREVLLKEAVVVEAAVFAT
jgi:hypothetical protein